MSEITLTQLANGFRVAEATVDAHVAKVVKRTAMKVRQTQRENVPKLTGKTRDSIQATGPNGAPFGPKTNDFEVGPTWFVGRLIELGTAMKGPRVFVANSLDPHLAAHHKEVADAVTDGALGFITK